MPSRRLDISSLLCPDSVSPSFQALVHAASEERRRLDQQDQHPTKKHRLSLSPPRKMSLDLVVNQQQSSLLDTQPLVPHYRPHQWLCPHNLSPSSPSPISPVFSNIHNLPLPPQLHPPRVPYPDVALKHEPAEQDPNDSHPQAKAPSDDVADQLLSLIDDRPSPRPKVPPESMPLSPPPLSAISPSVTSPPISPLAPDPASMPPPTLASALFRPKDKDADPPVKLEPAHASSANSKKDKVSPSSFLPLHLILPQAVAKTKDSTTHKQQKTKSTNKSKAIEGSIVTKQSRASSGTKKSAVANHFAASRSRSTSLMASGSVEPEPEPKYEEKEDESTDDKLYCVCETKYDEDRFMIACDRFVCFTTVPLCPPIPH